MHESQKGHFDAARNALQSGAKVNFKDKVHLHNACSFVWHKRNDVTQEANLILIQLYFDPTLQLIWQLNALYESYCLYDLI